MQTETQWRLKEPVLDTEKYLRNPAKHSPFRTASYRPFYWWDVGPDSAEASLPWLAKFDPYLRADIAKMRKDKYQREYDGCNVYALQNQTNLRRKGAKYGDDRWTHMKRCQLCDHDNVVATTPGWYRCQGRSYYGTQCTGQFEVTVRDAARARNMRPEDLKPYEDLSDRYDYEARRKKNMARTKALPVTKPPGFWKRALGVA
ncbi:uncharacterized protein FOMMEDRAFT_165644 [Fomitiporia mediterranea MF3/22]|uniref:uncharacterized protein n=1 Tax=Fomitiporia mediterranea (strain MF3/22) TaxID=694068 RepID=UPI00044080E9|nr:uncharacterized protein FOMMEDRAFT_165644 [Fomitiporia mediterranea MF3/22]EJD07005.1 hypothetical protein FOMMEDRAFT_165644 [Fomitiporia mediterranea MF3/22]